MIKVEFDLDVDCWISGVEIEGENYEECYQKLLQMSVLEMLESGGFVKDDRKMDIDGDIVYDEDLEEDDIDDDEEEEA